MDQLNIKRATLSIPQQQMDNPNRPSHYKGNGRVNESDGKRVSPLKDYSPFKEFLSSPLPIEVTLSTGTKHLGHLMSILPHGWIELSKISINVDGIHDGLGKLVFRAKEVAHIEEIKKEIK